VLGVSGRAMIRAIIDGEDDPDKLAGMAKRRLKGKIPELKKALRGRVTEHHRFLLRTLLKQIDFLEGLIAQFDARIEEAMAPLAEAAGRLRAIPGLGERAAEVIMAEVGPDMTPFPTAGHLSSWAGLCPGNDLTAGKRRSGKTTKGSQWLRTTLVQVAWAASHTKETIFSACYHRWAKRMGNKKALVAVAHKILVVVYHLLKNQTDYRENWKSANAA
jgi:transposase